MKLERIKSDWLYFNSYRKLNNALKDLGTGIETNIVNDIENAVDQFPNRIAIIEGDKSLTYRELDQRANQFAAWAADYGLCVGDCAALFMQNHIDYIPFWFGMAKVGVVTALINSGLTNQGLTHCVNISKASVLITSQQNINAAKAVSNDLTCVDQIVILDNVDQSLMSTALSTEGYSKARPCHSLRQHVTGEDVVLYIYTSGTTGLPKAVRMTHIRCLQMMRAFVSPCHITEHDRVLIALPLYHGTGGICGAGSVLISGGCVVLQEKFSASNFWRQARESKATAFVYVGELNRYLMNRPKSLDEKDHFIHKAFGNGMRPDVWPEFISRTGITNICEFYGSSEGNVSLFNIDGKIGAIGRIPPFMKKLVPYRVVKLCADSGEPLRDEKGLCIESGPGEPGEAIGKIDNGKAKNRFEGYSDGAESQNKILRDVLKKGDSFFRTGDLLKYDREGYYYFVDRLGDTFRWKSENVSTTQVSEVVSKAPGIVTANVYGVIVPGYDGRAGMAAITVSELKLERLHEYFERCLPSYARPVFLRVQMSEVVTGTMKFKKKELQDQGFNPNQIDDQLYVIEPSKKTYVSLDCEVFESIVNGEMRI